MEASLSSVPPVWPRPRPEIIGTKPPQAATIGASIRLTLSPTPPVECLSMIGPGRSRSSQSSVTPDCARPSVMAVSSRGVMLRKNTAMAKAATWLSLKLPSVMPRTTKAIASSLSSWPSRFLRMISCGSMRSRVAFEEPPQHPLHLARRLLRHRHGLEVAERLTGHAGGVVGHQRQASDLHAGMAGDDRLRDGRHAHGIGAQHAGGADLGRRLETRTAEPDIGALEHALARRNQRGPQRRVVSI